MKNKTSNETALAKLVKEKRDATEQRKLVRENAKKQRQKEEKARQADQKKAERQAAIQREIRLSERKKVEREQILRRKRLLSSALKELTVAAIEGSSMHRTNASMLDVRDDLEQHGFEFFERTESKYNSEALVKRLTKILVKQKTVEMQVAKAHGRLEEYLRDDAIPTETTKTPDWLTDGEPIYSFDDAFSIFQEFMHRHERLRDELKYWDELKSKSVWVLKEVIPEFQGLTNNQVEKAIAQKIRYWAGKVEDHEDWLSKHPNLVRELQELYRDVKVLQSIGEKLENEREDITNKLKSNEQTVFTYVTWRKKPSTRSNKSEKYYELNWLSTSAANLLFKRISEYLIRHANKSEALFLLSKIPNSNNQKLKVGRETFVVPKAVTVKTIIAKIAAWGFIAKEEKPQDLDHVVISVSW